jgi:hypothetical protein
MSNIVAGILVAISFLFFVLGMKSTETKDYKTAYWLQLITSLLLGCANIVQLFKIGN